MYLHVWICVVFNLYDFAPVRHLVGPVCLRNSHILHCIGIHQMLLPPFTVQRNTFWVTSKLPLSVTVSVLQLFVSIIQPFEAVAICPGCTQPLFPCKGQNYTGKTCAWF